MSKQLAVVENGVVINRIVGDPGFAGGIECDAEVCIGWAFQGGEFIAPPLPEPEPIDPSLPPLSARQFRLGLHANGLLASVQASIDALDEPDRTTAQIEWEYATLIERDHALVTGLASSLGLTDAQIDAMWAQALPL